jgi:two-component system, sensor histidine kinase PdtaS
METSETVITQSMHAYLDVLKLRLAYRISTLFLIVFLVLTYAYYFDSLESFITMGIGVFVSAICLVLLYVQRNYLFVFYLYSVLGVGVTSFALITFHETVHLADVLWLMAAVSLAFFGIGKRMGIILLIVALGAIVWFLFFSLNINIRTVQERTTYQIFSLVLELVAGFGVNIYLFMVFHDFYKFSQQELWRVNAELVHQNQLIKEQDEEKSVLVREVHHRVKNNLQIIISLLRTQSIEINDPRLESHFQESINRILVMSQIHKNLYKQESLNNIQLDTYLHELAKDLIQIYGVNRQVDVTIHTSMNQIGLKSIVPLGLLLNELLSNSLKYAFAQKENGRISISLTRGEEGDHLVYEDDGNWVERTDYKGFGLKLIETLTEQLDGTKQLTTTNSFTRYEFTFESLAD